MEEFFFFFFSDLLSLIRNCQVFLLLLLPILWWYKNVPSLDKTHGCAFLNWADPKNILTNIPFFLLHSAQRLSLLGNIFKSESIIHF